METQAPADSSKLKPLYWLAAAAMTIAVVLDVIKPPINWLSVGGRITLVLALVILATAKPAETRGKKLLIYGLIIVSIGLLVAKLVSSA
jgi:hypothetical protein